MAQQGRAFLLQVGDGDPGGTGELFTTVAGLRSASLSINNETVDVTTKDNAPWRELLANAGIRSMQVQGSGVFKPQVESEVQGKAMAGTIDNYTLQFEDGATFVGAFQITTMDYTGEHNGERQYSVTLESSGEITFTAAA